MIYLLFLPAIYFAWALWFDYEITRRALKCYREAKIEIDGELVSTQDMKLVWSGRPKRYFTFREPERETSSFAMMNYKGKGYCFYCTIKYAHIKKFDFSEIDPLEQDLIVGTLEASKGVITSKN